MHSSTLENLMEATKGSKLNPYQMVGLESAIAAANEKIGKGNLYFRFRVILKDKGYALFFDKMDHLTSYKAAFIFSLVCLRRIPFGAERFLSSDEGKRFIENIKGIVPLKASVSLNEDWDSEIR